MSALLQLLSVDNTFFTLLGYPISYIEFVGTLFNLAAVWLVARKNILNWPMGLVGVVLFGILFYQINLYADLLEQVYYFITGVLGWYMWQSSKKQSGDDASIVIRRNSRRENVTWLGGIVVLTAVGTWAMSNIHVWLPTFFPEPASLPLLDTGTTIVSFAATILMMQRKLESWILWIAVDVIAVWLYWYKEVPFIALLYFIFLCICINGFTNWRTTYRRQHDETGTSDRQVLPAAQRA